MERPRWSLNYQHSEEGPGGIQPRIQLIILAPQKLPRQRTSGSMGLAVSLDIDITLFPTDEGHLVGSGI